MYFWWWWLWRALEVIEMTSTSLALGYWCCQILWREEVIFVCFALFCMSERPLYKVPWQRPSRVWISSTSPWRLAKTFQDMCLVLLYPKCSFMLLNFISFPPPRFKTNKQIFSLEKKSRTNSASYFLPWFILYFFHSHYLPIEPTFLVLHSFASYFKSC